MSDVSRETPTVTGEMTVIGVPAGSILHARIGRRMVTLLRSPDAWWDIRPQPARLVWQTGDPELRIREATVLWVPPQLTEGEQQ